MTILQIYVACMIFGGVFVLLSVAGGADADADADIDADVDAEGDLDVEFDADADADMDADFDGDLDGGFDPEADLEGVDPSGEPDLGRMPFEFDLEAAGIESADSGGSVDVETGPKSSFNPLFSFKFWTFGFAFFGLTGFIFEFFEIWGSIPVFAVSVLLGGFAGTLVSYLIWLADQGESTSLTDRTSLGAAAEVLIPIDAGETGKVRMDLEGSTVDRRATAFEEGESFDEGEMCFVIGYNDEGVQVIGADAVRRQLTGETERRSLENMDADMSQQTKQSEQVAEKKA